jgi:hypothetical protein
MRQREKDSGKNNLTLELKISGKMNGENYNRGKNIIYKTVLPRFI